MLEEEIGDMCEKWLAELASTMRRMEDRVGLSQPVEMNLYRQLAGIEAVLLALQALCFVAMEAETLTTVKRRPK